MDKLLPNTVEHATVQALEAMQEQLRTLRMRVTALVTVSVCLGSGVLFLLWRNQSRERPRSDIDRPAAPSPTLTSIEPEPEILYEETTGAATDEGYSHGKEEGNEDWVLKDYCRWGDLTEESQKQFLAYEFHVDGQKVSLGQFHDHLDIDGAVLGQLLDLSLSNTDIPPRESPLHRYVVASLERRSSSIKEAKSKLEISCEENVLQPESKRQVATLGMGMAYPNLESLVELYGKPGMTQSGRQYQYRKSLGHSISHAWYEVKTAAFIFLRCRNNPLISRFQLACNVKGAGCLDDILLRYQTSSDTTWNTIFTMLKHNQSKRVLHNDSFFKTSGGFDFHRCFKSFEKIKQIMPSKMDKELFSGPFEKSQFVLYTSSRVSEKFAKTMTNDVTGVLVDLLSLGMDTELIFKFDQDRGIKELISILEEDKKSVSEVSEFLERLTVFCGQPTVDELDNFIKKELITACGGAATNVGPIYCVFKELFLQWFNGHHILDEQSDILSRALKLEI